MTTLFIIHKPVGLGGEPLYSVYPCVVVLRNHEDSVDICDDEFRFEYSIHLSPTAYAVVDVSDNFDSLFLAAVDFSVRLGITVVNHVDLPVPPLPSYIPFGVAND